MDLLSERQGWRSSSAKWFRLCGRGILRSIMSSFFLYIRYRLSTNQEISQTLQKSSLSAFRKDKLGWHSNSTYQHLASQRGIPVAVALTGASVGRGRIRLSLYCTTGNGWMLMEIILVARPRVCYFLTIYWRSLD